MLVRQAVPSAIALTAVLVTTFGCAAPTAPPGAPGAGTVPAPAPGAPVPRYPGELLDLRNWYLTLPTGTPAHPDTIHQPELATYSSTFFQLNETGDGVICTANAGGATTKGSHYPRSELREMNGTEQASWSNTQGTHTLTVREAVAALPPVKPEIVAAQIHDAEDDVLLVRLEKERLLVEYDGGRNSATLDPAYLLGTPYDLKIVAGGGRVEIFYNGESKAVINKSGSGWYFKAGSYVQSNPSKGEDDAATGSVILYQLSVSHAL